MKERLFIFILIEIMAIPLYAISRHGFGGSLSGGYSSLLAYDNVGVTKGTEVGGNVLYEFIIDHFLMQVNVGVGYRYHLTNINPINDAQTSMVDTDGDLCNYLYLFTDMQDKEHWINIEPSLLFGGEWRIIYFLGGVKLKYNVWGTSQSVAQLSTAGEYDHLIVPLQSMNNHYFYTNYPIQQSHSYSLKPEVDILGEIGIYLPTIQSYRSIVQWQTKHRVAAFVEYGITNISPKNSNNLIDMHIQSEYIQDFNVEAVERYPLYNSSCFLEKKLHSLVVGIKWTIVISKESMPRCQCYN